MNRLIGAAGLALLALLMLAGFLNSEAALAAPATLAALALTVGLPAAGAVLLARGHVREHQRLHGRKAELRRNTFDSEILRLAAAHGGRLTAVEVASELAMSPDAAREALESLGIRGHADVGVTDDGVLVYTFHDIRYLGGKESARDVLDG